MVPDLYDILGVPSDASLSTIKAAFRRKAKDSHPDTGGDPEAFRLLKLAYDVLSNADARRHYDETGETPEDAAVTAAEEGRFRALIGDLLVAMIAQGAAPGFTDVLREFEDSLKMQVHAVDQQLVTLSHLSARLEEVLHRLRSPVGEDFLPTLLAERKKDVDSKIRLTRALKTRLVRLQQKVALYGYDVELDTIL